MRRPLSIAAALPAYVVRLRCLGLVALACCVVACPAAPRRGPNVLVVVIDTLRADKLGAYGNPRGLTPFLDGLARRGTVFERTYAPSSWTVPSMASVFTSRYATQHGVVTFGRRIRDEEVTFGERLQQAGWVGGGFSANPNLQARFGHAQGFDEWRSEATEEHQISGDELRGQSLAWLDRTWQRGASSPVLLFLQYIEPHAPYAPNEPFRGRFAVDDAGKPVDLFTAIRALGERSLPERAAGDAQQPTGLGVAINAIVKQGLSNLSRADVLPLERLYDAEVAEVDDQLRRLFAALEQRGFLDDALVIVTSDHGEEFFEHGGASHGRTLYEESVRVPLILVGPGIPAGRRVEASVSLLDLAPTLLDLLDLAPESRFEGRSLATLVAAAGGGAGRGALPEPDILLQLERSVPDAMDGRAHTAGLVREPLKLLVERSEARQRVYDLAADPGETRPGSPESAQPGATLRAALAQMQARVATETTADGPPPVLDEKFREQLRALGYNP